MRNYKHILSQSSIKKSPLKAILILVTILLIVGALFLYSQFNNVINIATPKTIIIPKGQSFNQITTQLINANLGEHTIEYKILAKLHGLDNIKAGEYLFDKKTTPLQILKVLNNGKTISRRFTIPEGLYSSQVLEILQNLHGLQGDAPINITEGSLLPETYDYIYGNKYDEVISRMQQDMQMVLDHAWENRAPNLPLKDKNEALILASIIEKETGITGERDKVASVFINRLNIGMKLQTDPTVIYAITKGKYVLKRPIYKSDLAKKDPYNTYYIKGLPPTPICNPGIASIKAALNPADTDYLYFVANGKGGHNFSKTLREHNANVKKWREIEAGR